MLGRSEWGGHGGGAVTGVGQSSRGRVSDSPHTPTPVLGHSPKALSLSLPRRCCCPLSVAPQGQEDPAQIASEDPPLQTAPGQPRGPSRLPEAPPPPPGAGGARSPGGGDHQALAPGGRAGGGAGRAAGCGGSLPAWALPPHATFGLAARLARLAAGARGCDPALGSRPAPRPAGLAARALGAHDALSSPPAGPAASLSDGGAPRRGRRPRPPGAHGRHQLATSLTQTRRCAERVSVGPQLRGHRPQLRDTGQVSGRHPARVSRQSETLLCLWWPQIPGGTGFVLSGPSEFPCFSGKMKHTCPFWGEGGRWRPGFFRTKLEKLKPLTRLLL